MLEQKRLVVAQASSSRGWLIRFRIGERMCYSCSSNCDNCHPKMMKCPVCGYINYLKSAVCSNCGAFFEEKDRERARKLWKQGVRFGSELKPKIKPMSRTNSPFAQR